MFPYGQLKHLSAVDDSTASPLPSTEIAQIVNVAISSASFIDKCFTDTRASGESNALPLCRELRVSVVFLIGILQATPSHAQCRVLL